MNKRQEMFWGFSYNEMETDIYIDNLKSSGVINKYILENYNTFIKNKSNIKHVADICISNQDITNIIKMKLNIKNSNIKIIYKNNKLTVGVSMKTVGNKTVLNNLNNVHSHNTDLICIYEYFLNYNMDINSNDFINRSQDKWFSIEHTDYRNILSYINF